MAAFAMPLVHGFNAVVNGQRMLDLAKELVAISEHGLKARAITGAQGLLPDETHFLDALKDSLEIGKTPADELLELYNGPWGQELDRMLQDFSY